MSPENKYFDEVAITSRLLNIILDMPIDQQCKLLYSLDKSGCKGSRRHTRINLKKPWVVQVDPEKKKQSGDFFINDISRCGMFVEPVETSKSFFVGQNITMKFQIPASKKIFKIVGEIVRLHDNGMGVKFKRQL